MNHSDTLLASPDTSQITDSSVATESFRYFSGEALFRKPVFVLPQAPDTQTPTTAYSGERSDSSTAQCISSNELMVKATRIFASAKEQIFEDGMESDFSLALVDFITSYGQSAMQVVASLILPGQLNSEVVSETLRVIGRLRHKTTHRDRLWLLEWGLYSPLARVRDGATVGLAFLDDPAALLSLKCVVERELISELREDMEQLLAQLEDDYGGLSFTKDKSLNY